MRPRAAYLIADLQLTPHPEGGYYREVYRSVSLVTPRSCGADRTALRSIYFLLPAGEIGRWHRAKSDDVWRYYEGDPLEPLIADPVFDYVDRCRLGPVGDGARPVHVAATNRWQAARTTGDFTLVGCTVGPGFEFDDFDLLRELPAEAEFAMRRNPETRAFL
jgi:predicted cupin superfamily sugar epimerase